MNDVFEFVGNKAKGQICVRFRGKGMFVFRKIWHALFSWNTRFEIRPFASLPTSLQKDHTLYEKNGNLGQSIQTAIYGIDTPNYRGPNLWNLVPNTYKVIASHVDFKAKTKTCVPGNCP